MERNLVVQHVVGTAAGRPPHRTARPLRALAGGLAAVALGLPLAGCSALSPAVIATPYAAADGVEGSLTDAADGSRVDLRNMLIVAAARGGAGNLVGTLTNTGDTPVQVRVGLTPVTADQPQEESTVTVPARGALQLGGPEQPVVLAGVPAAGRMARLTVRTEGGGVEDLTVPVMAPQGFYATLTPAPAPTSSASSS